MKKLFAILAVLALVFMPLPARASTNINWSGNGGPSACTNGYVDCIETVPFSDGGNYIYSDTSSWPAGEPYASVRPGQSIGYSFGLGTQTVSISQPGGGYNPVTKTFTMTNVPVNLNGAFVGNFNGTYTETDNYHAGRIHGWYPGAWTLVGTIQ